MQILLGHPGTQNRDPGELHHHAGVVAPMAAYRDAGHHRLRRGGHPRDRRATAPRTGPHIRARGFRWARARTRHVRKPATSCAVAFRRADSVDEDGPLIGRITRPGCRPGLATPARLYAARPG